SSGRKRRLPKSRWIYAVVYKMGFYLGNLLHTDQAIAVKILLLRQAVFEGQIAKHRMSHAVHYTSSHLLVCPRGIHHDSTVGSGINFFQNRISLLHPDISHLCHIGTVGEINAEALGYAGFTPPTRLLSRQLDYTFHPVDVIVDFTYRIFLCPI